MARLRFVVHTPGMMRSQASSGNGRWYSQIRSPVAASMAWMTSLGFGM